MTGATPKGVLRIMGVAGLTIYHVKSHLQVFMDMPSPKRRILVACLPNLKVPHFEGQDLLLGSHCFKGHNQKEKVLCCFCCLSGTQITEALKLQMEVHKRLHEQSEASFFYMHL
ncbi:hypothetical protein B296_00000222 [Ensete ventricosum]|uniref:MYB-CC type transcription factor LHEQLE-containing domain-containing protein n=1 Tax=Ensete ventricosum TaxID=4639 RepID=A0A427B076_ENSVE|nr:hypothetical protein B296_00000222 [Ensete ventricosum]